MNLADLLQHIESLPDPSKDAMPPPVMASKEDMALSAESAALVSSLLNPKKDTEKAVKRVLEGRTFGGKFHKDGDYVTLVGGMQVWQKKVSDFVGEISIRSASHRVHAYVEVKGVSPGNPFQFGRLDKANNPNQPSQQEKLTEAYERKNIVWLAIGWWDAMPRTQPIDFGGHKKWKKDDLNLTISLVRWSRWLEIYNTHKFRSLRQRDRHLLSDCSICKEKGVWRLCDDHWWKEFA